MVKGHAVAKTTTKVDAHWDFVMKEAVCTLIGLWLDSTVLTVVACKRLSSGKDSSSTKCEKASKGYGWVDEE